MEVLEAANIVDAANVLEIVTIAGTATAAEIATQADGVRAPLLQSDEPRSNEADATPGFFAALAG